jgi:hypothetical protein
VIEQRKLHKSDKALYYWLKILANSIYGFFVELIPEIQSKNVQVNVFSGDAHLKDFSDTIENQGPWFFAPLASLITSAGRLLLAMTEACAEKKKGTYLFCDTDSLAIVSSKKGGKLAIPGREGVRILSWAEVQEIVDQFASLNPYDPAAFKGSILNLVDANFAESRGKKTQRQLCGYSIAANFLFLPMIDPALGFPFPKRNGNVLLVCPFSSEQKEWFDLTCVDVHSEKEYQLLNCKKQIENIPQNAVFPSQFARLLMQYQRHPEAKSLAPDGTACVPETTGLLKRAQVTAGDIRYVGKETDRKCEEGEDPSVLEFKVTEYGRTGKVLASEEVKNKIKEIGINKCARESGFDRKNFIRKLTRDIPVKRNSYNEFLCWLQSYKS